VRCFQDDNITHVDGSVDPVRDADIIHTELILADVQALEKALHKKKFVLYPKLFD
jgi:ribosome-binding ATPase YchF (GTP1/OBG family)